MKMLRLPGRFEWKILVALFINPAWALILLIYFLVYQQIENNFLQPLIYGRSVHLPPAGRLPGGADWRTTARHTRRAARHSRRRDESHRAGRVAGGAGAQDRRDTAKRRDERGRE